jgi:hypothetical protein
MATKWQQAKQWLMDDSVPDEDVQENGPENHPTTEKSWRSCLRFAGPGYLIAIGYMDPGNWGAFIDNICEFGILML